MKALEGQVAVITGTASGIGREIVRRYIAEGARVVAVDVSNAVHELPQEFGDAVVSVQGNVASWKVNEQAASAALDRWGKIDVFIGNAGITDAGFPLADMAGEQIAGAFRDVLEVNTLAPLLGVRACLDPLLQSRGSVILTGSFASNHASGGGVMYTASKHAVQGLIRQLAYELAPDIRVNGVAPGVAATSMKGSPTLGQMATDSIYEGTEQALPTQEIPPVSAFSGLYVLLASRLDGAAITGSLYAADSGLDIRGLSKPGGRVQLSHAIG